MLAACGSSDSSDKGGASPSGAASADLAAARAVVDKYSSVPTSIVQDKPLGSAPPEKKVAFIQCADPNCATLAGFMKDATGALGWKLVTFSASAGDYGAAIQQAIDAKVDYISITGIPIALYKPQMDEAKAKGIPLFHCYNTDVPAGPQNNLYSDCFDSTAANVYGKAMADWMAVDAGGSAKVLAVTIPSYPILTAQVDSVQAELGKNCPGCKLDKLEVTVNDLAGGAVPQNVTSYLQAHPDINYVYFTYNGLAGGVPAALKAAGMAKQVKLVGTQGNQPQFADVASGTAAAWSALPEEFAMWTMVDQMARLSVNEWSLENERAAAVPPFYIVDAPELAKDLVGLDHGWPGPAGYKDTFKKLWGV
ncbi:hypothetical protein BCD48_42210 [Pseudofrankia sp. BMG5.36]|nr:hypothetical protein BCD48_42210 [Pseudofrankia sp. BMG5.36]